MTWFRWKTELEVGGKQKLQDNNECGHIHGVELCGLSRTVSTRIYGWLFGVVLDHSEKDLNLIKVRGTLITIKFLCNINKFFTAEIRKICAVYWTLWVKEPGFYNTSSLYNTGESGWWVQNTLYTIFITSDDFILISK